MSTNESRNRMDLDVLGEELADARVKLERALAENDALIDRIRKVAIERDRIKEEADNRSAFWRKRFHVAFGVIIGILALTAFTSWAISERLEWVQDDMTNVKQSVNVLEKTTSRYAGKISGTPADPRTEQAERDLEVVRLRAEAAGLRREVEGLQKALAVLRKVKDSNDSVEQRMVVRLTEDHERQLSDMRKGNADEIKKLTDDIGKLNGELARANLSKGIAIPALIDALNHHDVSARLGAEQALKHLTNRDLGSDQDSWRRWWQANRLKYLVD